VLLCIGAYYVLIFNGAGCYCVMEHVVCYHLMEAVV